MPAIRHDDLLLRLVKEVNDIKAALRRTVANLPLFDIANENTPAQLTVDQDNYAPGNYDILRLSSSQAISISGIRGGTKGRFLRIFNDGNYPITLLNDSLLSDANNRFRFSSSYNAAIAPKSHTIIYYDSTNSRWVDGESNSSGTIICSISKASESVSVLTKITGFTVIEDNYSYYNPVSSKIIIRVPGVHIIHFECDVPEIGAEALCYIYIYKNGAPFREKSITVSETTLSAIISTTIFTDLDYGDEIEFYTLVGLSLSAGYQNIYVAVSKMR